jgi:ubiquinone/menaquinone biosynthesis C-methylase UbiE
MNKEVTSEKSEVELYTETSMDQEFNQTSPKASSGNISIPDYLKDTYYWSYLNPNNTAFLDQEWIVKLILWGQHNKLRQAAFSEIQAGVSVLQTAAVYGEFSKALSEHISSQGKLKVIDVAEIQVELTSQKLKDFTHAQVKLADASTFTDKPYDVVLCYFLLHEIPDEVKTKVLNNLLRHINPNGKLVIVDYHKPHILHPIRPITSLVFKFLEPFARTLWKKSLEELTSESEKYDWHKQNYFGGLFQKVVITKKKVIE